MEYSSDFDKVKAEKAEAIRRFNLRQNLNKLLLISSEVLLAFISLSWISKRIPGALKTAGDLFRELVLVLDRPLFGFFLLNLLILVVYILSGRKSNSPEIYSEYTRSIRSAAAENTAEEKAEEAVVEEKQIILENNAVLKKQTELATITEVVSESERAVSVSLSPVKQDAVPVRTVTGSEEGAIGAAEITETKRAVSAVMMTTKVKKKNYQRSQSEMFKSKIARVELRRSETAIRDEMLIDGVESPRKSMDELSNDEFRLTIESFIAENKKNLIRENSARILE